MRADPRRQTVYMEEASIAELRREAERIGVSASRVVQIAWGIAKGRIAKLPSDPGGKRGSR